MRDSSSLLDYLSIIDIIFLTMSDTFKVRKNTSLKDIKQPQTSLKTNKDAKSLQSASNKQQTKKMLKLIHLEPLKSDAYSHLAYKRTELKFDFTQPVNIKANSFNKHDCRYENAFLAPLEGKPELKQKSLDKENRPASMNELKYFNMAKMKLTLENTIRNESSKMFMPFEKKRESNLQEIRLIENTKNSQCKIVKSQSRTRLLKLSQKDQRKLTEVDNCDNKFQRTFRIGIIDQIFQKNKYSEQRQQTIDVNFQENLLNSLPVSESKISDETYPNSPAIHKPEPIFQANCSTIKERQQNSSSFMSKKAVQEFIQPTQDLIQLTHDRLHAQRKRKLDFDKIKKKFPENFFK